MHELLDIKDELAYLTRHLTVARLFASLRVERSPRLRKYKDIILSDGYASDRDHLLWVIRGKVGEIESWAQQIRRDSDAATNAE